ncbi:transglutaminase-like domain-containing protein [Candidatus Bathyarchaeota archaeon]|nr:transglutaminase-like domain-containing protein [Candidatus Bathyarchaeota archaeon]
MSGESRWKIVAVVIVTSALLGAVGWQQFAPKPTPPTTMTITPAVTTVSKTQITTTEARPANYYLSLLESNSSEPYVQLAKELRKLPELSNTTELNIVDSKTSGAVESIVTVVLKADRSELIALGKILNEGIPSRRKLCAPLQAWLWVAYDVKVYDHLRDYNPLKSYSLGSLLNQAWRRSTTSNGYNSTRWSYEEARERVNSPELVNWFIFDYLVFDMARDNVHPQGPKKTYETRRGVCRHAAYVATEFLTYNGYEAKDVTYLWADGQGHSVSAVKLDDGIWLAVDFRGRNLPMKGPFKTYIDVAYYIANSYGWTTMYRIFVEDNYQIMERNSDLGAWG